MFEDSILHKNTCHPHTDFRRNRAASTMQYQYGESLEVLVNIYNDEFEFLISIHTQFFKILLITYKSINDMAPEYLCELVSIRKSFRKLRSSRQILLQVPVYRLKSYSDFAFSVVAPTL